MDRASLRLPALVSAAPDCGATYWWGRIQVQKVTESDRYKSIKCMDLGQWLHLEPLTHPVVVGQGGPIQDRQNEPIRQLPKHSKRRWGTHFVGPANIVLTVLAARYPSGV